MAQICFFVCADDNVMGESVHTMKKNRNCSSR